MTLAEFLVENPVSGVELEIEDLSSRLAGFTFRVSAMDSKQFMGYQSLAHAVAQTKKQKGMDLGVFSEQVVINHTIEPNFKEEALLKKAGVMTPEQFVNKYLTAGEVVELQKRITELSGFNESVDDKVKKVKNSSENATEIYTTQDTPV